MRSEDVLASMYEYAEQRMHLVGALENADML